MGVYLNRKAISIQVLLEQNDGFRHEYKEYTKIQVKNENIIFPE